MVAELPAEVAHSLTALTIVVIPGGTKPIVLCQDGDLVTALESHDQLTTQLAQHGRAEHLGFHVMVRSHATYQPDRMVYDCLAFRSK